MRFKKEMVLHTLLYLCYLGGLYPIIIKSSLTNSGIINVYVSYGILLILWCYVYYVWIGKRREYNKIYNHLMMVYLLIGMSYAIITLIRLIRGDTFYKSIQMAVEIFFPVCIFMIIILKQIEWKEMLKILLNISTLINLYVVCVIISKGFRSNIPFNTNTVVLLAIINLFYFGFLTKTKTRILLIIFNISCAIIVILFSGSRTGFYLGITCCLLVFLINKNKKILSIAFLSACALSMVIYATDFGYSQSLTERATNIGSLSAASDNTSSDTTVNFEEIDQKLEDAVSNKDSDQILVASDMLRILLWKNAIYEIKKAPIIGTGEISFYTSPNSPQQTAHNFILEYALVFGDIGLFLWFIIAITILISYLYKNKNKCIQSKLQLPLFAASVCAFSMLQPTLSTLMITMFFWSIMGIFYVSPKHEKV